MGLKEYLSTPYQGWLSFLDNIIFPTFGKERFEDGYDTELLDLQPERKRLAESTGIRSVKLIGKINIGVEPLQIFDVTVADRIKMLRNRVNIQRLIHATMDQYSCALMVFHYEEEDTRGDWRITYCHKGERGEFSDSKRYTFILGSNQACRTAADNFEKLWAKKDVTLKDIEAAFNVEALSKEFFVKYKAQYERFVAYMIEPANGMRQNFIDTGFEHAGMSDEKIRDEEEKPIRDYVKKLLGRIVFLHFLQKKGWLGVPDGKEWGTGDRDFMLHLFEKASDEQKANFLNDVLEGLFAKALDANRSDQNDVYDTGVDGFQHCRIPYLNGGLFERDEQDKKSCHFPADYFANLLTMLSQYNFTIDENDPNDAEVGVDPEMLGRIFENLLEDNKDKGAFYTPKEIVQYMCRESLIAYLQTEQREEDKERIRLFVTTHDPELLAELKENISKRLCDVKICDPAIGSGAFPMGMLRELFLCRSALEVQTPENAAIIKRHIIQNNIYGVDIERGAVDIARLRFWLSLIVDETSPDTLPNLDFKIMQGNSLLEQFQGIDLATMQEHKSANSIFTPIGLEARKQLLNKLDEYYKCLVHSEKIALKEEITEIVRTAFSKYGIEIDSTINLAANNLFFLWHTWFYDVFSRPQREGFDIVIGNPPYGAKYDNATKRCYQKVYTTARSIKGVQKASLDTYTLFIELGYNLLRKNGSFAYIVPISLTSSDSLTGVHRLLMEHCDTVHISSYAERPKPVFENAMVSTSILLFQKTETPCQHLYATKMHRRSSEFNLQRLIENLQFVDVREQTLYGRIPKIGTEIEKSVLYKLFRHPKLSTWLRPTGSPIFYRSAGGRYFKVVTNYSNGSSAEREIFFENPQCASAIGCILSSNLAFWFYQIFSDNLNWKTYEIENFTIPQLSNEQITFLNKLYIRYLEDIEKQANTRKTSGASSYKVSLFKEYKIVHSKRIIDEIDDYICPLYGLTTEETEFIKNYELEFRLAGE